MTDAGVQKLSKNKMLETLDVGRFITADGAQRLESLPRRRRLVLRSSLISEAEQRTLKSRLAKVPSLFVTPLSPSRGPWEAGKDGFLRVADKVAREKSKQLEGEPAPSLTGINVTNKRAVNLRDLHGKVVLVDSWGLWCGPCMTMLPQLAYLQNQFGEQGLVVIGEHSQQASERLEAFLQEHPKKWPIIVDADDKLAKSFGVHTYPSLYLVDRTGRLRVALPHIVGLESAIKELLSE